VVHEIQQPLSAILLNCRCACQWLNELPTGSLPQALLESLQQLGGDGERVVATMERMRMLLRNVETEHTPVDLAACVDSGLLFLKNDLAEAGVVPHLEGLDQACRLNGDGAQLQIATVNLIRNALQAMQPQQANNRQLLLELQRHPDRVELHVADSGPGFPEAYSTDTSWELLKSTKASGMGIGLFIAQTAATNHSGQLRIGRSHRLGGAEVVLELPLLRPAATADCAGR
jgi:signal transduction histidine kinase